MSALSQEAKSVWFEAFLLAAESATRPLDADDLEWVGEAILLLTKTRERAMQRSAA